MARSNFGMPKARKGTTTYLCPSCGEELVLVKSNNKTMAVSCHKSAKKLPNQDKGSENYDAGCDVHLTLAEAERTLQKKG